MHSTESTCVSTHAYIDTHTEHIELNHARFAFLFTLRIIVIVTDHANSLVFLDCVFVYSNRVQFFSTLPENKTWTPADKEASHGKVPYQYN